MQEIISKENQLIKRIVKLKEKKYRDEFGEYLIEGTKILKEAIEERAKIKYIVVNRENYNDKQVNEIIENKLEAVEYIQVPNNIFKQISSTMTPQGVLAIVSKNKSSKEINFDQDIILALDDIQDPGNLGTIIRTADSVGLNQVIVSKGTTDAYNPKVIRSTMGAIFRVNVVECENLEGSLKQIQKHNYKIMVTSLNSNNLLYDTKIMKKAIVIGNEANGVKNEIINIADEKIKIPMIGKTESLNASVATGVVLYEYVRQKLET